MAANFTFEPVYLLPAIKSRYFVVPQYQRSYAWNNDQLNDFWLDMQKSIVDTGEYFLGSFVLSREDAGDAWSIIDGQQRIATTTILMSAIRDLFKQHGASELAVNIDQQVLQSYHIVTDSKRRRLRMNASDDPLYAARIVEGSTFIAATESHERILNAYDFFHTKLKEIIEQYPTYWRKQFLDIIKYLESQARVVLVQAETDADAFTIFETLNDRGADLTIADLLKNFLFSRAKANIDSVKHLWSEAIITLASDNLEKEFVNFLRQLWSSYYGITRERELYREIKQKINTPHEALDFAKRLAESATLYRAIDNVEAEFWSGYDNATKNGVMRLAMFGVQQSRPLMLAAMSSLPKSEISPLIKSLLSWTVRIIVAGNQGGGQVERYYSDAAVAVRDKSAKNVSQIYDRLKNIIPNDSSFRDSFAIMRVPKARDARYYLSSLERFMVGQADPELIINPDGQEVSLEHIMPQKADLSEWKSFTADNYGDYLQRLGNMTLLRRSVNSKAGNQSWQAKRGIIQESSLKINQIVSGTEHWDIESIELRQREMADMAVKIWKVN